MKTQPTLTALEVSEKVHALFRSEGLLLSLGGEPTFIAAGAQTAEWQYAATGPDKLKFAWKLTRALQKNICKNSLAFFCPGKLYPGETNPRWSIRLLQKKERNHIFLPINSIPKTPPIAHLKKHLCSQLHIKNQWAKFSDPLNKNREVWALLLDHDKEKSWKSFPWKLDKKHCVLSGAEGPAGLRLPMEKLAAETPRRTLVLDFSQGKFSIFLPALLQAPFLDLLNLLLPLVPKSTEWQAYLPLDLSDDWEVLTLAADPGVLEINLPPCESWAVYSEWIDALYNQAAACGLSAMKASENEPPCGSGGGSHLFFGTLPGSPRQLFEAPHFVARILRYWQKHPALSYFFTGKYVGAASQAPRADESGHSLLDLELALRQIEAAEATSDQRFLISKTLKHLMTDVSGNAHRAEISFDKFWSPGLPNGCLGVIEFRAIEALPTPEMAQAVALLWLACAGRLLNSRDELALEDHTTTLQDVFFLPTPLLFDLLDVLQDVGEAGFAINPEPFFKIMEWQFPLIFSWAEDEANFEIRLAHEAWPLLSETPPDGGLVSRYVDTSLRRLEIKSNTVFAENYQILINSHLLSSVELAKDVFVTGLRYRHSRLDPSLHPAIEPDLPLKLLIVDKTDGAAVAMYQMKNLKEGFQKYRPGKHEDFKFQESMPVISGGMTHDLRF
ncbi:MAG: transglutaminase family protein [Chthoniobacterales bacterium]